MELQGKSIAALDVKTGQSARGEWQVQEFVLETFDGQYSRKMVFSVFGSDRLQRFNIQVGQEVNVAFDIDAREYNGRWFNSIRAYDVRQIIPNQNPVGAPFPGTVPGGMPGGMPAPGPIAGAPTSSPVAPPPAGSPFGDPAAGESSDDLPF